MAVKITCISLGMFPGLKPIQLLSAFPVRDGGMSGYNTESLTVDQL